MTCPRCDAMLLIVPYPVPMNRPEAAAVAGNEEASPNSGRIEERRNKRREDGHERSDAPTSISIPEDPDSAWEESAAEIPIPGITRESRDRREARAGQRRRAITNRIFGHTSPAAEWQDKRKKGERPGRTLVSPTVIIRPEGLIRRQNRGLGFLQRR